MKTVRVESYSLLKEMTFLTDKPIPAEWFKLPPSTFLAIDPLQMEDFNAPQYSGWRQLYCNEHINIDTAKDIVNSMRGYCENGSVTITPYRDSGYTVRVKATFKKEVAE